MATTTKNVDINVAVRASGNGSEKAVRQLKDIETQANRTREKMEKLANVGNKMAMVGGAMLAPFALALKKYVDSAKDTERVSSRILELNKRWEAAQVRIGRVTAETVLPLLEKAMNYLDKIVDYAEKNPEAVKAALTIGATLIILGGIVNTTAQIVSTISAVQGLASAAGMALGGGGAAAAGGGVATALGGVGAAVGTAITAAIPAIVAAFALWFGGNLGLIIGNGLAGTNQTWADIGKTIEMLPTVIGYTLKEIAANIGNSIASLGSSIWSAVSNLAAKIWDGITSIANNIRNAIFGGKAAGGYMTRRGLYPVAENNQREFVLNAQTTRNAERAIGGKLDQRSASSYVTNTVQLSNGMTVAQSRQIARAESRRIMEFLTSV